jgi:cobalt-zinc-cadmium efflux system protein
MTAHEHDHPTQPYGAGTGQPDAARTGEDRAARTGEDRAARTGEDHGAHLGGDTAATCTDGESDHPHGRSGDNRHVHGPGPSADGRLLGGALALIVAYMAAEVAIGIAVNSLALLSDAAHMLTDAGAIGLALVAMRLAARPARGGYTYGLRRAEILSAQANGITLLLLAGLFGYEAIRRLIHPQPVGGLPVLLTALAGVLVNLGAAWLIRRADRRSLNVEGAYQHILTDLAAFIATAIAGVLILTLNLHQADTVASLVVVVLMVRAGVTLVKESSRILLEAAPAGLDPARIGRDMAGQDGVVDVHDLHVWDITSGAPALSAHVIVAPVLDCHRVRIELESLLRERYGLTHTTLQVDHAPPTLHRISPR